MIFEHTPLPFGDCYFHGECPCDDCDTCDWSPPSEEEYIEDQRRIFREEFYEYVDAFKND